VHLTSSPAAAAPRLDTLTGASGACHSRVPARAPRDGRLLACGNPSLHIRIPNLAGFCQDDVIILRHFAATSTMRPSRIRVRVIEVSTAGGARGPPSSSNSQGVPPGWDCRSDESALSRKLLPRSARSQVLPILFSYGPPPRFLTSDVLGERRDARRLQRRTMPARRVRRPPFFCSGAGPGSRAWVAQRNLITASDLH